MRKILLALALVLVFSGCMAHTPKGGEFKQARDSAYKIEVTMKLDLKPYNDFLKKKAEEKKAKEEAKKEEQAHKEREEYCRQYLCFGRPHAVFLAKDAMINLSQIQESTDFYVRTLTEDTAEVGWSGTGWIGARGNDRTFVMTAGHVCESKDIYPVDFLWVDWDTFEFELVHLDLPILEKHHAMLGRDGVKSVDASVIRDEDLDDDFNGNDLCMLGVSGDLGNPIPVALHDPEYGDSCSVVGAPTGLWGGGIAVPSDAIYAGRGAVFGTEPDGLAFNGLLAPGNSGSAVICDGQVVGTISLGSTRFRSLIHAVPEDRIRVFMDKALHSVH